MLKKNYTCRPSVVLILLKNEKFGEKQHNNYRIEITDNCEQCEEHKEEVSKD